MFISRLTVLLVVRVNCSAESKFRKIFFLDFPIANEYGAEDDENTENRRE